MITQECQERGVYRLGLNRLDYIVLPEGKPGIIDFGNVLFHDDPIVRAPGSMAVARLYQSLRLKDLRSRYVSNNGSNSSLPDLESKI